MANEAEPPDWVKAITLTPEQRAELDAELSRLAERFPCPNCGWKPDDD